MDDSRLRELFNKFELDKQFEISGINNRILIVDGMNLFIRSFAANPTMNHRGDHIGGLLGFIRSLFSMLRQFKATRCILVFDGIDGGKQRRKKLKGYKSGRKNKDRFNRFVDVDDVINETESFKSQFQRLEKYLHLLPCTVISIDYIEADDVIGFISKQYYGNIEYGKIIIASTDKDFLQLINTQINIWSPIKKILYDLVELNKEYTMTPNNYLTYRILDGDVSDNIPGVKGVGLKTLKKYFPSIITDDIDHDDIIELAYSEINNGSKLKIYHNIIDNQDQIELNWELMQLHEVDISHSRKITIRKLIDGGVYKCDIMKLRELILYDGIHVRVPNVDSWITNSISQINIYGEI